MQSLHPNSCVSGKSLVQYTSISPHPAVPHSQLWILITHYYFKFIFARLSLVNFRRSGNSPEEAIFHSSISSTCWLLSLLSLSQLLGDDGECNLTREVDWATKAEANGVLRYRLGTSEHAPVLQLQLPVKISVVLSVLDDLELMKSSVRKSY
jgi:hypothetical protein